MVPVKDKFDLDLATTMLGDGVITALSDSIVNACIYNVKIINLLICL